MKQYKNNLHFKFEQFFYGHDEYDPITADIKKDAVDFNQDLRHFCDGFLKQFESHQATKMRLLGSFIDTCRKSYQVDISENKHKFNVPIVGRDNCLYDTQWDRSFVQKYGFKELEQELDKAAYELTKLINGIAQGYTKYWFEGLIESTLYVHDMQYGIHPSNRDFAYVKDLFKAMSSASKTHQHLCVAAIKNSLNLDCYELVNDVLAVHILTRLRLLPELTEYEYNDELIYTCRHLRGIQGAYKKIANALAAIDRASKDGNESEEDAIKHLDEISANFATILDMTPVSGNTEGELS